MLLLMHPRVLLAALATRAHCWLVGNLLSTSTPTSFSAELPPSRPAPARTGAWGCSSPGADPTLAFAGLHQVPLCPALQPVPVSLNGSAASWCISHSSQLCVTCKRSEGSSVPSSCSSLSLLDWGAQRWTQHSSCSLPSAEQRGRITSLDLLAMLLLMHPRVLLAALATRAHCWLVGNLLSTSTPTSFSAELPPSRPAPARTGAWGCSSPGADPTLAFAGLHQVPLCPALQPVPVSLNGSAASWCISHSSQLCVTCKRSEGSSVPSSWSLMSKLNRTGPSTDPWGTPLATGLQLRSVLLVTTL
ncbi:uncharacterized protein LOC129736772 [Falco cherrug]|uniref:uncharacterized protein LOC129736772 n=1 Tax=Falco cherrug TaxID=345164 RepID=UPI00247A80CB|nr:uncharacterized protein LOC129736772 [Falco cherrug]